MEIRARHFGVLGGGREGVALTRYLAQEGAHVTVTDDAGMQELRTRLATVDRNAVDVVETRELRDSAACIDALFVSPGVAPEHPVYAEACRHGTPIESMTTLFFALCPGPIVGITGSSGKTTTTGLTGRILQTAGVDAVVGGNIGDPMIDLLPRIEAATIVVLELSSFQLEILRRSPHVSVVTNVTPNHLDRHGSMDRYIEAKRHIVSHQTPDDFVVLNSLDAQAEAFAAATPAQRRDFGPGARDGATVRDGVAGTVRGGQFSEVLPVSDIPLLGAHNVENVLAAIAATDILGVPADAMSAAIRGFRPAAHRLETVGEVGGVRFVDDSIATTPARAEVALRAIDSPILLLAGGRDKRLPWDDFARAVVQRVRVLLLLGEAAELIENAVNGAAAGGGTDSRGPAVVHCTSVEEAVFEAARLAHPGETVLLSPACTSYDMFENFEERGRAFATAVRLLDAA